MAAMHFTKASLLNVSKANIPGLTSLSFPHKFSRVCFTSPSKHFQRKHASEETNNGYNVDETINYSGEKSSEMGRDAKNTMWEGKELVKNDARNMKDKANEVAGKASERTGEMKEKAKDTAAEMKEKAKEVAGKAADRAGEVKEKAKEKGEEIKESADETAYVAAEKADEGKNKAAEMAKAAKDKTMGAAETVAEKTKQTVAGAWDAAKQTTHTIKETVVGTSSDEDEDEDEDEDDWGGDRRGKKALKDEDVGELRRKVGNLDHEKKDY